MHGLILSSLERFTTTACGPGAWPVILAQAGVSGPPFDPGGVYPDADVMAIVGAASAELDLPAAVLLERFGHFVVPDLLAAHGALVPDSWRTLDLLAHTEYRIHETIRASDAGAAPPRLRAVRPAPNEVRIIFASRRRLCAVARGIVRGVADHYGDHVTIDEPRCLHRGDAACELVVRQTAAA